MKSIIESVEIIGKVLGVVLGNSYTPSIVDTWECYPSLRLVG